MPLPEQREPRDAAIPSESTDISRYFLVLFQSGDETERFGDINRLVFQAIQEQLDEKIKTPPSQNEIDVWLDSPGGSASVAFKLVLELRSRCRKLRMVVPDYAKSAATLVAIGGDEIYLAPAAELGPLDAQIEHPDREGVPVSALDVASAYDFLGEFALNYSISGGGQVFQWIKLPRTEVLREFLRFTALLLRPAVNKLDPHLIHRATNQLELAHKYAEIVLKKRALATEDKDRDFDPRRFADHLVRHYPAHEYVISYDEAKQFGLPVKPGKLYPNWQDAVEFQRFFRQMMHSGDLDYVIRVWNEDDFREQFEDDDEIKNEGTADAPETLEARPERLHKHRGAADEHVQTAEQEANSDSLRTSDTRKPKQAKNR